MSEKLNETVVIENVRLSFPQLFEPRAADDSSAARYSASFLLGGETDKNVVKIRAAVAKVAKAYWPKLGKAPKNAKLCLRDQEDKAEKELAGYEAGNFYLSAARSQKQGRPLVIDRNKSPLTAEDNKVYGGCYVNAKVSIYAKEHPTGGPMVNASLEVVQFVKDGEPFGGGKISADDMPEMSDGDESSALE